MNIRDIVNKDTVNLTNCESEPIHIPGSIQPHGCLLAVAEKEHTILFCSANTKEHIGIEPALLLNKKLDHVFSPGDSDHILQAASGPVIDNTELPTAHINNTDFNITINRSGNLLILEFEPFPDGKLHLPNLYTQTKKFTAFIEQCKTLRALCQAVAEETRNLTGYDRVMIYRFDADYNGEVFAESKRDDLEAFLGLHYPHTDIPVQARELYMRNLSRMIADVNYTPVPIVTTTGDTDNRALDLSHAVLRSVSPIHIEYLKNMGVGATLTISLIHNKKLWGLISCHHYSAHNLPHYTRLAAQLQGHFLTSQINVREVAEEYDLTHTSDAYLNDLQNLLLTNGSFVKNIINAPALLKLVNADGCVIIHKGKIMHAGEAPAKQEILDLDTWLSENIPSGKLHTHKLSEIYPPAAKSAGAAGIIYHALSGKPGDCIIWYRKEVEQTVNWGGNPTEAIIKNAADGKLSPRKSFALWKQIVKLQSLHWSNAEINAAFNFAQAFDKQLSLYFLGQEEDKYRKLSEELLQANNELANFNWITTHDLKEPLRKIQVFASRILDDENAKAISLVTDSADRMKAAAQRMQELIEDVLLYSNIANKEKSFVSTDLNEEWNAVKAEYTEEIFERNVMIEEDHLPTITAVPFQVRQLFVNLLSNAIKFAREDEPLHITLEAEKIKGSDTKIKSLSPQKSYYKICFTDNGIGFDDVYNEKIFNLFNRLNAAKKYSGTGIGLAICKKIMENHGGAITASGKTDKGSVFCLYFSA